MRHISPHLCCLASVWLSACTDTPPGPRGLSTGSSSGSTGSLAGATAATGASTADAPGASTGGVGSTGSLTTGGDTVGTTSHGGATTNSAVTGDASATTGSTSASVGATSSSPDAGDAATLDSSDATLVPDPSWTCGMPEGIPAPAGGTEAFTIHLSLSETYEVGTTQFGDRRFWVVDGGSVEGPQLSGSVREGGLDWELIRENGVVEVEQVLLLQTDDGDWIYLRNCGVAAAEGGAVRIVPDFEAATSGSAGWLNDARLVGTRELDPQTSTLAMRFYALDDTSVGAPLVTLQNPPGAPAQNWECPAASGSQGDEVLSERVGIGSTVSIGQGKRGRRQAIPITGGSFEGRIAGDVLAGGADFQLLDGGFVLDARYVLRADDGELILVRNCGPGSELVPTFETRAEGPHAWLNTGSWLSPTPGIGLGSVNISIRERR